jgi:hypothetical protein
MTSESICLTSADKDRIAANSITNGIRKSLYQEDGRVTAVPSHYCSFSLLFLLLILKKNCTVSSPHFRLR